MSLTVSSRNSLKIGEKIIATLSCHFCFEMSAVWILMTWLCRKRPKPPTEWLQCFSSLWKSLHFLFFSCTLNMTTKPLFLRVRFSQKRESSQATAVEWPRSTTLLSVSWPPSKLLFLHPFLPPSFFPPCFPWAGSWAGFTLVSFTGRSPVCSLGGQRHLTGYWSGLVD